MDSAPAANLVVSGPSCCASPRCTILHVDCAGSAIGRLDRRWAMNPCSAEYSDGRRTTPGRHGCAADGFAGATNGCRWPREPDRRNECALQSEGRYEAQALGTCILCEARTHYRGRGKRPRWIESASRSIEAEGCVRLTEELPRLPQELANRTGQLVAALRSSREVCVCSAERPRRRKYSSEGARRYRV